ncbi:MFS transporter [Salinibacterium sp. NYA9b]
MAKRPPISFALKVLYGDTFTMAVGFYMLVPLLAYHFLQDLTLTIAVVAALTALRTAAQNGMMPIAGWVADRINFRRAILIGVLVRALGFAMLGTVESIPLLVVASIFTGLGGALFHPASYSAYAALTTGGDRVRVYSTREVVSNVGFIVGPIIGGFLAGADFAFVSLSAAAMFVIAFIISAFGLPHPSDEERARTPPRLRVAFADAAFLRYCALVAGTAVLIAQFYLVIPFRAAEFTSGPSDLGFIYSGAAVVMVITMLPLTGAANRFLPDRITLAGATACLGAGVGLMGLSTNLVGMLVGVAVFIVGQMLVQPVLNATVSRFAPDGSVASYFGVQGLANAIGGAVGSGSAGVIYALADSGEPGAEWVWLTYPAWAILVAIMFVIFGPRAASGSADSKPSAPR